jgi:succinate dehydrogenase hydrophobic anchor subunit
LSSFLSFFPIAPPSTTFSSVRRTAFFSSSSSSSSSSTAAAEELPAQLQTKREDYLLSFKSAAQAKEALHYTSYFLAFGLPSALVFGAPVSTVVDLVSGVVVPLHAHMGMRAVIVDYVWSVPQQRMALGALAAVTVLMTLGLTKFNLFDVGLTGAIKTLYIRQSATESNENAPRARLH